MTTPTRDEIHSMSPDVAAAALAEMSTAYAASTKTAPPSTRLPTRDEIRGMTPKEAGAALEQMKAAKPVSPATAADARKRLDALSRDATWGQKYIAGDPAARAEF